MRNIGNLGAFLIIIGTLYFLQIIINISYRLLNKGWTTKSRFIVKNKSSFFLLIFVCMIFFTFGEYITVLALYPEKIQLSKSCQVRIVGEPSENETDSGIRKIHSTSDELGQFIHVYPKNEKTKEFKNELIRSVLNKSEEYSLNKKETEQYTRISYYQVAENGVHFENTHFFFEDAFNTYFVTISDMNPNLLSHYINRRFSRFIKIKDSSIL